MPDIAVWYILGQASQQGAPSTTHREEAIWEATCFAALATPANNHPRSPVALTSSSMSASLTAVAACCRELRGACSARFFPRCRLRPGGSTGTPPSFPLAAFLGLTADQTPEHRINAKGGGKPSLSPRGTQTDAQGPWRKDTPMARQCIKETPSSPFMTSHCQRFQGVCPAGTGSCKGIHRQPVCAHWGGGAGTAAPAG